MESWDEQLVLLNLDNAPIKQIDSINNNIDDYENNNDYKNNNDENHNNDRGNDDYHDDDDDNDNFIT